MAPGSQARWRAMVPGSQARPGPRPAVSDLHLSRHTADRIWASQNNTLRAFALHFSFRYAPSPMPSRNLSNSMATNMDPTAEVLQLQEKHGLSEASEEPSLPPLLQETPRHGQTFLSPNFLGTRRG
jgi:hypothetical protein